MASTQYDDLIPLGESLPLRVYLRSLWQRRQFAVTVPLGELRARHMNTVLGNLWQLLNPILLVAIYYLVFGLLLGTNRGIDNFITYLAIGVFSFRYMQSSIMACAASIVNNQGLIRSLSFPRAILPVSAVVRETVAFAPPIGLMLLLAVVTREPVRLNWLLLIPATVLMGLFALGLGFVVARLTDSFHDLNNVLPFIFRLTFYLSGILYSFERFAPRIARFTGWSEDTVLSLVAINPFYAFISQMRHALMTSYQADPVIERWLLPSSLLYPAVFLIVGFLFFRAGEQRYGRG